MSKILKIRAGVRYYEDSLVNGTSDIPWEEQKTGEKPRIPCVEEDAENRQVHEKWVWCPVIDAETGVILNWEKGVEADICYKVCDECGAEYYEDDLLVCNNDGYFYCPEFLSPGIKHDLDYIMMDVDASGCIKNWDTEAVSRWVEKQRGGNKKD